MFKIAAIVPQSKHICVDTLGISCMTLHDITIQLDSRLLAHQNHTEPFTNSLILTAISDDGVNMIISINLSDTSLLLTVLRPWSGQ